jgi:hypothetical protein
LQLDMVFGEGKAQGYAIAVKDSDLEVLHFR